MQTASVFSLSQAWAVMVRPERALAAAAAARPPLWPLARGYVLPLALVGTVAQGVGLALGDAQTRFGDTGIALQFWVLSGIASVAFSFAAVLLFGGVADLLAPWFGGRRDFARRCGWPPVPHARVALDGRAGRADAGFRRFDGRVLAGVIHAAYLAFVDRRRCSPCAPRKRAVHGLCRRRRHGRPA